jgi:hypothetical protein
MTEPCRRILTRSSHFRGSPEMLLAVNELANRKAMHPSQIVRAAVTEFVTERRIAAHISKANE